MKIKAYQIVLLLAFFFAATTVSAQVNRTIGSGQYKRSKPKGEKIDFVQQTVNYFTKELKLDDFQAAAVRQIIESEKEALMDLAEDRDISPNERADRGKIISDRIDAKILPLLSKEQTEKYRELQEKNKKQ